MQVKLHERVSEQLDANRAGSKGPVCKPCLGSSAGCTEGNETSSGRTGVARAAFLGCCSGT